MFPQQRSINHRSNPTSVRRLSSWIDQVLGKFIAFNECKFTVAITKTVRTTYICSRQNTENSFKSYIQYGLAQNGN